MMRRGLLIVFEGCDRVGKTTQINKLAYSLKELNHKVEVFKFPERSTTIGSIIDSYLKKKKSLDDHATHLLFSANRWECIDEIKKHINSGVNVLIDRYAYSGIAYSSAKKDMSFEWCKNSDAGLPKPDLVIYLEWSKDSNLDEREGFGEEIYENLAFQKKVKLIYDRLKEDNWCILDCTKGIEEVQNEILNSVKKVLNSELNELKTLFTNK